MTLKFESGRRVDGPTANDIVNGLPHEEFTILSIDDTTFLQCCHAEGERGKYVLEYRAGENGQFVAVDAVDLVHVFGAFEKYRQGDPSWRDDFDWQPLPERVGIWQRLFGRRS